MEAGDKFLEALGYTWHDTCFVCAVSTPFTLREFVVVVLGSNCLQILASLEGDIESWYK